MQPSDEQQCVIRNITNGISTCVNSVAGAGKTTTLIFIADQNRDKSILQVTYNKQLKLEVRNKIRSCNLNNVEIHTYHSLGVKYYDPSCFTDENLVKVLRNGTTIKSKPHFDIIVIDEVQDMTPNYYELLQKFMFDITFTKTILILGDTYQGVYEFKNADTRFLTLSSKLWGNRIFSQSTLHQSYRVTQQIAWFVNKVMLGNDRIISHKNEAKPVYYYKKNVFYLSNELFNKIKYFLANGYKAEDIFVLSPSIKNSNNPVKKLENLMVKNNIPVYFSRNEEEGIDENIIARKAVFTTFHQSKGRERKIVIVFGFDDTYFDFYAKEKNKNECPSELYVAITRSSSILIIVHHDKNPYLSFLKMTEEELKNSCNIQFITTKSKAKKPQVKEKKELEDIHNTTVIDLTAYLGESILKEITKVLRTMYTVVRDPCDKYTVDIPLNVKMKNGLVEDVSDINGIVIPAIYEAQVTGDKSTIQKIVEEYCDNLTSENYKYIEKKKKELVKHQKNTIAVYLLLGNLYIALTENILSKLNQIDRYDWLSEGIVKVCHKNIKKNIQDDAVYEKEIASENDNCYVHKHPKYGNICISARIDACDNSTLWEIKCTSKLNVEHMLQLIVYAWLWENCMKERYGSKRYKLLNIRTAQVLELEYDDKLVNAVVELLFMNKFEPKIKESDEIFLAKCQEIRNRYVYLQDIGKKKSRISLDK
jgi:hypothetical protein